MLHCEFCKRLLNLIAAVDRTLARQLLKIVSKEPSENINTWSLISSNEEIKSKGQAVLGCRLATPSGCLTLNCIYPGR